MSPSGRLLARLLPLALPLTVACGAKSELLSEDPDEGAAGRGGSGSSSAGAGGRTASGGNVSSAGTGGSLAVGGSSGGSFSSSGGGPVAAAGAGGTGTTTDLPPCALSGTSCPTLCYVGAPDETCLPGFPEQPVHERFGCEVQIAGSTTVPDQKPGECCYAVGFCGGGRPIFADGVALIAPLRHEASWL